ncbi:Mur ligase family protein [Jeotgalicoccus sp. WY2]|uniref:Mur ligase family protein n=1 Tax=Jeotgalicoccus sp. WY2 TaxID=2708346 RepID=UPI001BD54323|nr:Mur ligase family protein [Jeotgalicoccus sp. WY2]
MLVKFYNFILRSLFYEFKNENCASCRTLFQYLLHRFTTGGSSLPGKLALAIDPNILTSLSKDYRTIIITGTNGKTVTTGLTVNILKQHYNHVLTNPTGANMQQGIVSTFLSDNKDTGSEEKFAVLEVDEASVKHITKYIS